MQSWLCFSNLPYYISLYISTDLGESSNLDHSNLGSRYRYEIGFFVFISCLYYLSYYYYCYYCAVKCGGFGEVNVRSECEGETRDRQFFFGLE